MTQQENPTPACTCPEPELTPCHECGAPTCLSCGSTDEYGEFGWCDTCASAHLKRMQEGASETLGLLAQWIRARKSGDIEVRADLEVKLLSLDPQNIDVYAQVVIP